jgi:hypothetical protein
MNIKSYVADELANKVFHLTKALDQTKQIVNILEKENSYLKECLDILTKEENLVEV